MKHLSDLMIFTSLSILYRLYNTWIRKNNGQGISIWLAGSGDIPLITELKYSTTASSHTLIILLLSCIQVIAAVFVQSVRWRVYILVTDDVPTNISCWIANLLDISTKLRQISSLRYLHSNRLNSDYSLSNVIMADEKLTLFHKHLRYRHKWGTIVFCILGAIL